MGFPGGLAVNNLPAKQETWFQSLGQEDALEEGMAIDSSILAWEIPWTEEPGGLQRVALMGSQSQTQLSDWITVTAQVIGHHSSSFVWFLFYLANKICAIFGADVFKSSWPMEPGKAEREQQKHNAVFVPSLNMGEKEGRRGLAKVRVKYIGWY